MQSWYMMNNIGACKFLIGLNRCIDVQIKSVIWIKTFTVHNAIYRISSRLFDLEFGNHHVFLIKNVKWNHQFNTIKFNHRCNWTNCEIPNHLTAVTFPSLVYGPHRVQVSNANDQWIVVTLYTKIIHTHILICESFNLYERRNETSLSLYLYWNNIASAEGSYNLIWSYMEIKITVEKITAKVALFRPIWGF